MPSKRLERKRLAAEEASMENLKPDQLPEQQALRLCKDTCDISTIVTLTKHSQERVRQKALVEMCPCRVKTCLDHFWERVFEMLQDPSTLVRKQVLHTLCDGSPKHLEHEVSQALEHFNCDADPEIRRMAHKALISYQRTGKWNVL